MSGAKIRRIDLRLPEEMAEQIETLAEAEIRTVHAQILYLLREQLASTEMPENPIKKVAA